MGQVQQVKVYASRVHQGQLISMQGFTLKLSQVQRKPNFDVKINEVNGSRNIGQGHRVKVKGMSRTLLCKVSHSQVSLMQRKPNFDVKINKVNGP